jgi:hypothetical protein
VSESCGQVFHLNGGIMPKVNYTNAKGLFQETGSGLVFTSGDGVALRKKVISLTGSGASQTLTAADSGAVVFLAGSDASTVTLPDHAAAGAGWFCTVIAGTAQAHVIDTGADDILQGQMIDAANGTTVTIGQITDQQNITLANPKIGDRVEIICDGTNFHVLAVLNDTATLATS